MTRFPKLAALAVVILDDRVLLVKRRNPPDAGVWGFPGGHVELGETAMEAAAREMHEEIGVLVTPSQYLTNVDVIERTPDGDIAFHFLLVAVSCDYVRGTPNAQDDASAAEWHSIDAVLSGDIDISAQVDAVLELALVNRSEGQ